MKGMAILVVAVVSACSAFFVEAAQAAGGVKDVTHFDFRGRDVDMYIPDKVPAMGKRALLVVLHGGMGNAEGIRQSLQMDGMADKYGFLIAYLNGNPARINANMKTWNAGACCGLAQHNNVDDVGYITAAIGEIEKKYGVDSHRVYGMGHSNGAMMTQRVMCETGVYQAAVPVSGPLEWNVVSCPAARGKRLLAIHGAEDKNVPIAGGRGSKGISNVSFHSEADTQHVYEKSGASYKLWVIPGADHKPQNIAAAIAHSGLVMQEEVVKFLGIAATHN